MAESVGAAILRWLRAGYPEGVPPKDYFPLLALLRRTLSSEELDSVVDELAQRQVGPVRTDDIRAAIERVTSEPPAEDDVRAVASRLAAAGWPLSGGADRWAQQDAAASDDDAAEPGPGLIDRVLGWLRRGYPEGIPVADYVPILAVLRRRLSDEEVEHVAAQLIAQEATGDDISRLDARVLMTKVLDDLPSDDDLRRVEERLASAGLALG